MGAKGSQTTNTSQNQTYTPTGSNYITGALGQAQNLAGQSFNVPTAPVAGFNGQQTNAFGLANNTGIANPYIQQASQNFQQGSQPNIAQFYNPEASAVTAQLGNIFGQQAAQNTGSLTQAAGGVGADRIAIGQGNLANQQGLAAGQTLAGLYTTAGNQALQEQGAQQSAGYGQLAAGTTAQQANIGDINTLLGTGGLQQQLQQAQLNAPYQQQLAQLALPYQLSQFGTNATASLAPALGGTTQGTGTSQSQYNPSIFSQILGAGLVGGSLFANRGGTIPMFAGGGGVSPYAFDSGGGINFGGMGPASATPIDVSKLFSIPTGQSAAAHTQQPTLNMNTQAPNLAQQGQQGMAQFQQLGKLASQIGGDFGSASFGGGNALSGDAWGGDANNPLQGLSASDYGMASGGAAHPYGTIFKHRFPQGYDDGGATSMDDAPWPFGPVGGPSDPTPPKTFEERAGPTKEAIATGDFDPQGMDSTTFEAPTPLPVPRPPGAPSAPPPAVASDNSPGATSAPPGPAASASPDQTGPTGGGPLPAPGGGASSSSPFAGLGDKITNWTHGAGPLLMQAGLSAWTPQGIAGGFQQGMKSQQGQQELSLKQKEIEQAAKRLALEQKAEEDKYTRTNPYQQYEMSKPFQAGVDLLGHPIMVTKDKDGNYINVLSGKKAEDPRADFTGSTFSAPGTDEASIPANARYTAGENVPEGVNPEILSRLPPLIANKVRAVDEGRINISSIPMKQRDEILNYVTLYDPNWDQATWGLRNKQNMDLSTNGNAGKMILAVNQLLPHLKTASDAADALHNSNYPAANTFSNWWATQTGDPKVKKFEEVREVASMDAARLLRGSGQMAEKDIEFWRQNLSSAGSPQALQQQIALLSNDLIGARIGSIKQSYQMNMRMKAPDFVSPEATEAAAAIMKRAQGTEQKPQGQPQRPAAPPQQPAAGAPPPQQPQPQGGGAAAPPPQAIAMLKQHPEMRDKFDAKYGPGAAAAALGQ